MTLTALSATPLGRDVALVEGPEAGSFLHGQVSQDVESLAVGESRLSLLLEPRGRLEVFFRITRAADARFVLDTEPGFGDQMCASLERFKLRTKADFSRPEWSMLAVRGPGAAMASGSAEVAASALWPGGEGVDLLGLAPVLDVPAAADFEALRCAMGLPAMGVDVLVGDIPNETGLVEQAASFSKGCYRGQELVERIDSRAGGRRMLRRFRTDAAVRAGDVLHSAGEPIGEVRSASELDGVTHGFAFVAADTTAAVTAGGEAVELVPVFG